MQRLDTLPAGCRFRLPGTGRTGRVVYVVPEMRVRVKIESRPKTVKIGNRVFQACPGKLEDWAPSAEVEPLCEHCGRVE